jgi:excisionase family DNA binding protein
MDNRLGQLVRRPEPDNWRGVAAGGCVMSGRDNVRDRRERDKLTIAEVCADLGISRRTFYEWRAKGRAPRCITLPNGSLRIRRSEYQRWLASREEAA